VLLFYQPSLFKLIPYIISPADGYMSGIAHRPERQQIPIKSELPHLDQDLYREIFTHSTDAIAVISLEGYYLEQNAAHRQLLGYSDEEIQGQTPAIHMGKTYDDVARELAEKGEYRGLIVSQTKAGERRDIELSAFTMRNRSGEPVCFVGIKHDVTERKRAEEALQRNDAELGDFFENAAVGLHWIGADGRIIRVNQAELDLLGYSREEYLGHRIEEFYLDTEAIREVLRRLKAGEVLRDYEARLRCKDGSIRYVQVYPSALWDHGRFVHTRCFTHDITARKRTERRLALQYFVTKILSESSDFLEGTKKILKAVSESLEWEVGALWKVDAEAQLLRCIGVWSVPSVKVKAFAEATRNSVLPKGLGLPGRILANGEPAWIPNLEKDDNFPRAEVAIAEGLRGAFGFPIRLGGDVLGVIEFFSREIREPDDQLLKMVGSIGGQLGQFALRKKIEEERTELLKRERVARAEAEQANRLKDEFLATLSHELRTPLNAVIGWSRLLTSGRLDKENSKHAVEVIERNAWSQKQIIEDILDVSRVITGKLQLNVGPLNIVTVIEAALDAMRPALEAKDIKVEASFARGLRTISGDSDRLQQVVWNLLSNAAKFTPAGGKVAIRVCQNASHVQIQIEDTGPGIEPAFLPHVFERFRQADGSTTRTYGGLGLGLAIVRHLVELHGGTITAENSTKGGGAIFNVNLPLPSGELNAEARSSVRPGFNEAESTPPNLENLHILVVEDEVDALDLITVELTQHGAKVTGVTTSAEALDALEQSEFNLLICDIGLPDVNGYELIRQIRKGERHTEKRIPAVALTAYARVQDRLRAIMAGFNTHVAKPVEGHELVTVVASLADRLSKD